MCFSFCVDVRKAGCREKPGDMFLMTIVNGTITYDTAYTSQQLPCINQSTL